MSERTPRRDRLEQLLDHCERGARLARELLDEGQDPRAAPPKSEQAARLDELERENAHIAQRSVEIEEENNELANLYVASYQLHSTLDLDEVMQTVREIVVDLIGAEVFAIYLLQEEGSALAPVASQGRPLESLAAIELGQGVLGRAVAAGESKDWDLARSEPDQPVLCVPFVIQGQPIGAIAVYHLRAPKRAYTKLDHQLFDMLGGHAATAILAAKLYAQSERKLNTIQGFLDLLTH